MISVIKYLFGAIALIFAQILIFSRIEFGWSTYVMVYPLFLLLLPFRMNRSLVMLIAFVMGISIDFFLNTFGLNASALVLLAYFRPNLYKLIHPNENYDREEQNDRYSNDRRFLVLLFFSLLLHHAWYFLWESFSLHEFLFTLIRIGLSTLLSTVLAFLLFLLLIRRNYIEE